MLSALDGLFGTTKSKYPTCDDDDEWERVVRSELLGAERGDGLAMSAGGGRENVARLASLRDSLLPCELRDDDAELTLMLLAVLVLLRKLSPLPSPWCVLPVIAVAPDQLAI